MKYDDAFKDCPQTSLILRDWKTMFNSSGDNHTCKTCQAFFENNKNQYMLKFHAALHFHMTAQADLVKLREVLGSKGIPLPGDTVPVRDASLSVVQGPQAASPSLRTTTAKPPPRSSVQATLPSFVPSPLSASETTRFQELMMMAIVHGAVPFRFLENQYFLAAIEVLRPKITMPGQEVLHTLYDRFVNWKKEVNHEVEAYSLDIDLWTGRNKNSFFALNVFYMTDKFELKHMLWRLAHFKGKHEGKRMAAVVQAVVEELKGRLVTITSDHAANMGTMARELEVLMMGCICHFYHLLSTDCLHPRVRGAFDVNAVEDYRAPALEQAPEQAPEPAPEPAPEQRPKRTRVSTSAAREAVEQGARGIILPEESSSSASEDEDDVDDEDVDDDVEGKVAHGERDGDDLGLAETDEWRKRIPLLLYVFSRVSGHFQTSTTASQQLRDVLAQHNATNPTSRKSMPVASVKTRWATEIESIRSITELEAQIGQVLPQAKDTQYTFDAISAAMKRRKGEYAKGQVTQPPSRIYEFGRVIVEVFTPLQVATVLLQTPAVNIHLAAASLKDLAKTNAKMMSVLQRIKPEERSESQKLKLALASVVRQRITDRISGLTETESKFMGLGTLLCPSFRSYLKIKDLPDETSPTGKRQYWTKDAGTIVSVVEELGLLKTLEDITHRRTGEKAAAAAAAATTTTTAPTTTTTTTTTNHPTPPHTASKRRVEDLDDDDCSDWRSDRGHDSDQVTDGNQVGLREGLLSDLSVWLAARSDVSEDDIMKPGALEAWWGNLTPEAFPTLRRIARLVFVVRSTSVESERVFSKAGYMMGPRRARIKPATFERMMLLDQALVQRTAIPSRSVVGKPGSGTKAVRFTMSARNYLIFGKEGMKNIK